MAKMAVCKQFKKNLRKTFCQISARLLTDAMSINLLRPNNDVSETSHCNIKSLSVSEDKRIENMMTQVQFY